MVPILLNPEMVFSHRERMKFGNCRDQKALDAKMNELDRGFAQGQMLAKP